MNRATHAVDWTFLMNRRFIVAVLLVVAVPVCVQAQNPKVSMGDAQKVVTIISGDKAKTQAYCDIRKLSEQIEDASAKKDGKAVEELSLKIETLEKNHRSRICRIDRWA
jgi:peptidoglycan hydrolase CwlO-like protein